MKSPLNTKMEIAFYNVIDHRCDKAEKLCLPVKKTCKNLRSYTERFINFHEMSDDKKEELRDFTELICRIISTPPKL